MNRLLVTAAAFFLSIGVMLFGTNGLLENALAFGRVEPANRNATTQKVMQPDMNNGKFDEMHRHLYKIATKPAVLNRTSYRLGAVKETTGGLGNSDRELLASLYYNATSVFEFGLGESTQIASYIGVPRYAGVDSDAAYVGQARKGTKWDHFRFSFSDIGSTAKWGRPTNANLQKIPFDYQTSSLNNELEAFDFYLVDGRYRVACACASFLHAMSRGGDMSRVMVAVHDWAGRPYYRVVTNFADIVHKSRLLAVMKLKHNTTEQEVMSVWENHIWDQR